MDYHTYSVATVVRTFLMTSGAFADLHVGQVKRDDGRIVWQSTGYRAEKTARLQASNERKKAETYLAREGRCWLDVQDIEKAAREAHRKHMSGHHQTALQAFKAGWAARREGKLEEACPYPDPTDSSALLWRGGWKAAALALDTAPPMPKEA